MDKLGPDQAEGLRRLVARSGSRVVAVTAGAPGVGCTSSVVNLAAALAEQGKDVLVVDECGGDHVAGVSPGGVDGAARFIAAMNGKMPLNRVVRRHESGFGVLAAPRRGREACTGEQLGRVALGGPADVVLIDAELDSYGGLSALARQTHEVMVVTRVAAQAITEAYACIKRLHAAHAIHRFRVLVNYVDSPGDARTAFENLALVAGRYLAVSVADAGSIRADAWIEQAGELKRCVVDAFPAAAAARDYRHVATGLLHWPVRPAMPFQGPLAALAVLRADNPSAQPA